MNTIERAYNMSDVVMLTSSGVIAERGHLHLAAIEAKKSAYADPYFPNLRQKIQDALTDILGFNNAAGLILSTDKLLTKKDEVITVAKEFKVQVLQELRTNRSKARQYLTLLGFSQWFTGRKTKQSELMELLFTIKKNVDPALESEMAALKIDPAYITKLIGYADEFGNLQISQENMKLTRKLETAEDIEELNAIYNEVFGASLMIQTFFEKNKVLRSLFSFNTIAANLKGGVFAKEEEEQEKPEDPSATDETAG